MELGDIVIYRGRRYYVRGIDPVSVHPRFLYLEDVLTGKTLSVALEQPATEKGRSRGRLRLVRRSADKSSTPGDPAADAQGSDPTG